MPQTLLETVDFSTGYTAGHLLSTDSANWTSSNSLNMSKVCTGAGGVSAVGDSGAVRTGQTWTNDHWVQATVVAVPGTNVALFVRMPSNANTNGYSGGWDINLGDGVHYYIHRVTGGASVAIAGPSTAVPTAGDVLNLQAVGTTITLTINGTETLSHDDATYTTDNPGLRCAHSDSTTKILSTWTAGSVTAAVSTTSPMFRGS